MSTAATIALEKNVDLGGFSVYKWDRLAIYQGLTDRMLCHLYLSWEKERTLPLVFHRQAEPPSLLEFLQSYLNPNQVTLGCWAQNENAWDLVGCMWVNGFFEVTPGVRRADVGMGFLRHMEQPGRAKQFAQLGIEYSFDHLDVGVLGGMTPAANRAAVVFSRRLGFQVCGPIDAAVGWHGEIGEGFLSTMTKQRWAEVRPWKE